jgi:hypothetical protein
MWKKREIDTNKKQAWDGDNIYFEVDRQRPRSR